MNAYAQPGHERANSSPTPAEVAWMKVVGKEFPGIRVQFTHQNSVGEVVCAAVNGEQRIVGRADGVTRLEALKALHEKLKQNPPAPVKQGTRRASNKTREQMLMRIRLAQAEM